MSAHGNFEPAALRAACIENNPEAIAAEFLKVRQFARLDPLVFGEAMQTMGQLAQDMIDFGGDHISALRVMRDLCLLAQATEMPREPVIQKACSIIQQTAHGHGDETTGLMVALYNLARRNKPLSAMVVETALAILSEPDVVQVSLLSSPAFLNRTITANSADKKQLDRVYCSIFRAVRSFAAKPENESRLLGLPATSFAVHVHMLAHHGLQSRQCQRHAYAVAAQLQRKISRVGNYADMAEITNSRLEIADLPAVAKLPEPFVCRSFMAAQVSAEPLPVIIMFGATPDLTRVFGGASHPRASGQSLSAFRTCAGILNMAEKVLAEPQSVPPFRKAARVYRKTVLQVA